MVIRRSDYLREILLGLAVNCQNFGLRAELKRLTAELNEKLDYKIVSAVANINRQKTNKILADKQDIMFGSGFITEKIGGHLFKISLNTFWQVNTPQAARAYAQIAEWCAAGTGRILDAYCGIGAIALSVADLANSVLGVEENPQSIKDARRNAENNGVSNARFICGRVEDQSADALGAPEIIIADPPRKGLAARAAEQFLAARPAKIIYLSCNPASLARDLKLFLQTGQYKIREIIPYDFFPQTTHIETLVLLERTGPGK
jgi:23S rRNA (uracil1939-C5)-methyltransferase